MHFGVVNRRKMLSLKSASNTNRPYAENLLHVFCFKATFHCSLSFFVSDNFITFCKFMFTKLLQ